MPQAHYFFNKKFIFALSKPCPLSVHRGQHTFKMAVFEALKRETTLKRAHNPVD